MKIALLVSILTFCNFAGFAQAEQTSVEPFDLNLKVKELASLPVGLSVTHSPGPVHSTLFSPSLSGVQWKHDTTVTSLRGPVTIVEYGYFIERNEQWELPYSVEVPDAFTSSDFEEMYDCPNSELKPGESYTNAESRSVMDCVPEQRVRWYFIGVDRQGHRVKGETIIQLLSDHAPVVQGVE
jgi:hypothetical protein